jgi:hypothetical protein
MSRMDTLIGISNRHSQLLEHVIGSHSIVFLFLLLLLLRFF